MKFILSVLLGSCLIPSLRGQWVLQGSGYNQPFIETFRIQTVSSSVVWSSGANPIDPFAGVFYTRTNDGGQHWHPGHIEGYTSAILLKAHSYDTAWFLAANSMQEDYLLITTDGGLQWILKLVMTDTNKRSFTTFFNSTDGFSIGNPLINGGYFHFLTTVDGGDSWQRVPSGNIPAPVSWNEMIITRTFQGNHIWLTMRYVSGGTADRILYSSDKGHTWSVKNYPIYIQHVDWLVFQDSLHGLALGGLLLETWDNCQTWSSVSCPQCPGTTPVFIPGTWNTLVGRISNKFGYSTDGGKHWTPWDTLNSEHIVGYDFADPMNGWAGTYTPEVNPQDGGIWKFCGDLSGVLSLDARKGDIHVFPNPCGDELNLVMAGFEGKNGEVCLFDVHGRKIRELYQGHMTDQKLLFSLGKLPAGLYLVKAAAGDKTAIRKVMLR